MMYQKGVDYLWVAAVISDSDMRDSLTDLILTTIGAAEGEAAIALIAGETSTGIISGTVRGEDAAHFPGYFR